MLREHHVTHALPHLPVHHGPDDVVLCKRELWQCPRSSLTLSLVVRPTYRVSFFQRCVWTLILGGYFAAWIYLTEKFILAQKLPIIGASERQFTQSQVRLPFRATLP